MLIHHITLLTGHTATHRLDTIAPGPVAACRALLPDGGTIPGFAAYRVQVVQGLVFTVSRGAEPIVTCGVGQGLDATWSSLCQLAERVGPVATRTPPSGHWLAVVLLPGLANTARSDISWIGDFERCMAAALLLPAPSRGPGRPPTEAESAVGHIHMRVTMDRKNSWVRAAQSQGLSLSDWIEAKCDPHAP
jgi:hypothetical protein